MKRFGLVMILGILTLGALSLTRRASTAQEAVASKRTNVKKGLLVVDASGNIVGPVIIGTPSPSVAIKVGSAIVAVEVGSNGFLNPAPDSPQLDYATSNCSGQVYLPSNIGPSNYLITPAAVGLPGQTLYIQSGPAQPEVLIQSQFINGTCEVLQIPTNRHEAPAAPTVDLGSMFLAPFKVISQ